MSMTINATKDFSWVRKFTKILRGVQVLYHRRSIIYFLRVMAAERGHEMAKKKNGVVPLRLVVQRINRRLAAKGQILIKAAPWMRMVLLGAHHSILDLNGQVH